jgi:hypothetical protein
MTTFKLLSAAAIAAISLSATAFAADTATAPAATENMQNDGKVMTAEDAANKADHTAHTTAAPSK